MCLSLKTFCDPAPVHLLQCLSSFTHQGEPLWLSSCFPTCQSFPVVETFHLLFCFVLFVVIVIFLCLSLFSWNSLSLDSSSSLMSLVKCLSDCPCIRFIRGSSLHVVFSTCFFFFSFLWFFLEEQAKFNRKTRKGIGRATVEPRLGCFGSLGS